ncbi:hypothetical protein F2Q68_00004220, partial [Brassica cretica]
PPVNDSLNRFCDAVSYQDSSMLCHLLSFSSNSPSLLSLADALNVFHVPKSKLSDLFIAFRFNFIGGYPQCYPLLLFANLNLELETVYVNLIYEEILAHLFPSLQSYRVGNLVEAYLAFEKFANAFVQKFRNWESAWALEALYVVSYEIRILAEKADKELTSNGKSPEKLKAAGSLLMKGKGPKRVVALYVTCQLFKTCFKLGTVNLCRSVIRSIETARIFDFEEFPRRDKVTYMYYTGRLEVFNENFPAADTKLSYKTLQPQKRTEYKVLKLSLGIIPKDELLQKYNLHEYMNVVQALRKGDLRLLRHALQEHEDRFLRSGVYLVLEKLELQVYQRLMKKIFIIQKLSDPARSHQLKLEVIAKALRWLEINMDLDEVECIMTILILQKPCERLFGTQEQSGSSKQARSFP